MNTWIFQGNPEKFDIEGYLAQGPNVRWVARQHTDEISAGDRVFFWVAGAGQKDRAGVVAAGYVLDMPSIRPVDPASNSYWVTASPRKELSVGVRVERVADRKHRIRREWLVEDAVLGGMLILRQAAGTNFLLDADEAARLEALWSRTGENWTEAESLAGLWAYAHTRGREISKGPKSLVAEVALLTGRAVSGVYNKVMNFRSLDPTDKRKGLSGAGEEDRRTWNRYFDRATQGLRLSKLDAAYKAHWGSPGAVVARTQTPTAPKQTGQSYESDARVRRAIEQHAMALATQHYEAAGFKVEDTHAGHPFDLRCRKGGEEVRVEVKGTRGDGSSVLVTIGEVTNARAGGWRSDLFIAYCISLREEGGKLLGTGGARLIIEGWQPEDARLVAQTFRYAVDRSKGKQLD